MPPPELPPEPQLVYPIAATFVLSSVGSLAHSLKARRKLTRAQLVGASLNSGVNAIFALGVLGWQFPAALNSNPLLIVSIAASAGIGNASLLELAVATLRARAGGQVDPK
ncbi:MAG TPA: hypothetical protein VN716_18970 [Vicinamibacterales bacterium]|nr:hypothetical protein [Vicinamibacterales bacterium]